MSIDKNNIQFSKLLYEGNGHFEKSSYLGHVTFVQFIEYNKTSYLLTGIGADLNIYHVNTGSLLLRYTIFPGGILHGGRYDDSSNSLLLWGQKRLAYYNINWSDGDDFPIPSLTKLSYLAISHWIWDAITLTKPLIEKLAKKLNKDDNNNSFCNVIAIGTSHNTVEFWSLEPKKERIGIIKGRENYILYCSAFSIVSIDNEEHLQISVGTVFNQVIIWYPLGDDYCIILNKHDGVIWKITLSNNNDYLLSAGDDRTCRLWKLPKIIPKEQDLIISPHKTFFGHTARVWDCKFINSKYIVTAGEDTSCIIWSIESEKIVQVLKGHQGRSVWRIDVDTNKLILASGGGDSSIRLYDLRNSIESVNIVTDYEFPYATHEESNNEAKENMRAVCLTNINDNIRAIILTNRGFINSMDIQSGEWEQLYFKKNVVWNSCAILDYDIICAGDIQGFIHLIGGPLKKPLCFKVSSERVSYICKAPLPLNYTNDNNNIIISFVCSTSDSLSSWWIINASNSDPTPEKIAVFESYDYIEHKRTKKVFWCCEFDMRRKYVWMGDSFGSIYTFKMPEYELGLSKMKPIFCKLHVHNRKRVTSILIDEINNVIYTCGKDGIANTFILNEGETINLELIDSTKNKNNFGEIERLMKLRESMYIIGTSNNNTLFYDWPEESKLLMTIPGVNGKTPHDIFIGNIKGKDYYVYSYGRSGGLHNHILVNEKPAFKIGCLNTSFHGREANSVSIFDIINEDIYLIATTSEDTTIKIFVYDSTHKSIKLHQTLTEHICATRTTADIKSPKLGHILFSGGGKLLLKCWRSKEVSCDKYMLTFSCVPDNTDKNDDTDSCRIMQLSCAHINEENYIVVCARSDRKIAIYIYDGILNKLKLIDSISHNSTVLCMRLHKVESKYFLITGDTNGDICIWNISDYTKNFEKSSSTVYPILNYHAHQFSVDSIDIQSLNDDKLLITSGGHDQRLFVSLVKFDIEKVCLIFSHFKDNVHNSSISCIKVIDNLIFTSGPDQRLCVWKVDVKESELDIMFHSILLLELSDVSDIDIRRLSNNNYLIVTVGRGMQIVHFQSNE